MRRPTCFTIPRWFEFYRRLARTEWGDALIWNCIVKINHRMLADRGNRSTRLTLKLNGRTNAENLFDAQSFVSIFGWGIVWGWRRPAAKINGIGDYFRTWQFGRIAIEGL